MAPTLPDTPLNRYRVRFLEQLLTEATATYWQRRAHVFDQSRPRPGDYTGRATDADLAAADQRCRETAAACRNHARILRTAGLPRAASEALLILSEPSNNNRKEA
jgi:hypothetical protein